MIGLAAKFVFDNPIGKALAAGVLAIGVIVWFASEQRSIGASSVTTVAKQKAKDNVILSHEVRRDLAAGKRGTPDPSRMH